MPRPASAPRPAHHRVEHPLNHSYDRMTAMLTASPAKSRVSNSRETIDQRDSHSPVDTPYELECDYDTSATVLYELLESSSWEKARSRCRSHPDEIRTWIIRKDKNGQVRWKLLPLHAAIIFQSPSFVVSALLERYPAAASRKDDQGMLPLHLAFRHKQEDEDLLELLLAQYPKAVVLRDRRERVPLEHGRDSRYSAKLLRLYADATLAASKGVLGTNSRDTHTTHTESLTQTHSASVGQLKRMEAEHEAKLAVVRADYEYQLKTMKGQYEDRIQALQDDTNAMVRQAEATAEDIRQALINQHKEEIGELRDLLARQVSKDRSVAEALQKEVQVLQESLQQARHEAETLAERYQGLLADNEQLRDFLQRICEDQAAIQDMVVKQQEYFDASRAIRMDLIQTLQKQEEKDGEQMKGTKMLEIANKVQIRINDFIELNVNAKKTSEQQNHNSIIRSNTLLSENRATQSTDIIRTNTDRSRHRSQTPDILRAHSDKRGVSRVEVERGDGDRVYSDKEGQTEVQVFYEKGENARNPEEYSEVKQKMEQPETFGEVRILGDDISAITENSAY